MLGAFNGDGILDVLKVGESGLWLFTGMGRGAFNPGDEELAATPPGCIYSWLPQALQNGMRPQCVVQALTGVPATIALKARPNPLPPGAPVTRFPPPASLTKQSLC